MALIQSINVGIIPVIVVYLQRYSAFTMCSRFDGVKHSFDNGIRLAAPFNFSTTLCTLSIGVQLCTMRKGLDDHLMLGHHDLRTGLREFVARPDCAESLFNHVVPLTVTNLDSLGP